MIDTPDDEVQAAFPDRYRDGMTLRDYFAAQAMNGLVGAWGAHDIQDYKEIALDAYVLANAMLKAREA